MYQLKESKLSIDKFWQRYGTLGILILLIMILAFLKPASIFSFQGINQILTQSSVNILLALGEFVAILIAGIDLSVGSMAALVGMVTAKFMVMGMNPIIAITLGILLGVILGAINGGLINATGLHPFIITLGTQAIYRGLTIIMSDARSVFGFPATFTKLIGGSFLGIPMPVVIAIFLALILGFITTKTKLGRNIYALGGNVQSAWFSGINIRLHKLIVFMISGFFSGVAGIVLLGRVGAAEPAAATGFETYAIAAAIIGGTSFFGGKGKVSGVVIGGLIIGLINYAMNVLTISSSYQQIVMGSLIIASVTLDRLVSNKR